MNFIDLRTRLPTDRWGKLLRKQFLHAVMALDTPMGLVWVLPPRLLWAQRLRQLWTLLSTGDGSLSEVYREI